MKYIGYMMIFMMMAILFEVALPIKEGRENFFFVVFTVWMLSATMLIVEDKNKKQ